MHYRVYGNGPRAVVLMHGWGASGEAMRCLVRAFPNRLAVLPDLYGFGKTPHPDHPLRLSDYVDGIIDLLGRLGIKRAIFVGHSFGGRVAIKLAAVRADLVEGLVLINSAGVRTKKTLDQRRAEKRYKRAKRLGLDVSQYGSSDYRALSGAIKSTFVAVVNEDLTGILGKIHRPTLVVTGGLDEATPPATARVIKRKIRGATLLKIDGAGHFSYLDAPNVVRRAIQAWQEEKLC